MVNLNIEQISKITQGTVRIEESDEGIWLYRFTKEQEKIYKNSGNMDFYRKSFATAGIKMVFRTDSKTLFLKVSTLPASSRVYFSHDVYVNGKHIDSLTNYCNVEIPMAYAKLQVPLGDYAKEFDLGKGVKTVEIYFPWSVASVLRELSVEDSAFIESVKASKKILAFGDSITQGYDALYTSNTYISRLSRLLDVQIVNKGIGGEVYCPPLAEAKDEFTPDAILVSYGTNDWNGNTQDILRKNCRVFYAALRQNYPDTPIFVITPIWRKDMYEQRKFGAFGLVEKVIEECIAEFDNIHCISGFTFVEQNEDCFGDLRLHPNDKGFAQYAETLYERLSTVQHLI